MFYIAFEYADAKHTTTGPLNAHTGKRSIAGNIFVFTGRAGRDIWISKDRVKREALTKAQAWELQKGMMRRDFDEMIARLYEEEQARVYEAYKELMEFDAHYWLS